MIIGITGKKRSGKDTIADFLEKEYDFVNYKLASPIKNICRIVFLWDDEWINGEFKETIDPRWGISPREAQQIIGTELFRQDLPSHLQGFKEAVGDLIWVKLLQHYYQTLPSDARIIVSDLRFLNEEKLIRDLGGVIVRVNRDGLVSQDTHPSEMEMEKITADITIDNNSTIEALYEKVEATLPDIIF